MLLNFRALDNHEIFALSHFDGCCQRTAANYYRADLSIDFDSLRVGPAVSSYYPRPSNC